MEHPRWGSFMRRNLELVYDLHGHYVTNLYTNEANRLINGHNIKKPLFLFLSHNAVHSGNPYNPIAAPDDLVAQFENITVYNRRRLAGVLSKLDESVGKVVGALDKKGMLKNSVIIFSTDNGGPAEGFNINAASNWPLRGVKNTLWEGGVRGAGLLWSPLIKKAKRVYKQLMHISDWMPTLFRVAGGNISDLGEIDGQDLWDELSCDETSKRNTILHNIDDIYGNAALMVDDWKLVKGTTYNGEWDNWYGPSGRNGTYEVSLVVNSIAGKVLEHLQLAANKTVIEENRQQSIVKCPKIENPTACKPLNSPCLFNIRKDPCEENNLADAFPNILTHLKANLELWNKTAIPPGNKPIDLKGDPKYWDYTWTNFGDFIVTDSVVQV